MNTNQNSSENFRNQVNQEINSYNSFAEGFRADGTPDEDIQALSKLDYIHPDDNDLADKALKIFENKSLEASTRLEALGKIADTLFSDTAAVQAAITVLADSSEDDAIRSGTLNTLLSISFSSPALRASQAEFLAALRVLADDGNRDLQSVALETLASYGDEFALDKIRAGLDDPAAAVFPLSKSIQLLGLNRSGEYNGVIREKLRDSDDPDVQIEAIHALSADKESEQLIQDKLKDKDAFKDVRLASLKALQHLNSDGFVSAARDLLADDEDYRDIRVAAINSVALLPEYASVFQDNTFTDKVKSLAGEPFFKKASDNYLSGMNNSLEA